MGVWTELNWVRIGFEGL